MIIIRPKRERTDSSKTSDVQPAAHSVGACDLDTCPWMGEWSRLEAHKAECALQVVECRYCKEHFVRRDTKTHMSECPRFPLRCAKCGKDNISRAGMATHVAAHCSQTQVECSKCRGTMKRAVLGRHLRVECPEALVACEYAAVGCEVQVRRRERKEHLRRHMAMHLRMTMCKLRHTSETLDKERAERRKDTRDMRQEMDRRFADYERRHVHGDGYAGGAQQEVVEEEEEEEPEALIYYSSESEEEEEESDSESVSEDREERESPSDDDEEEEEDDSDVQQDVYGEYYGAQDVDEEQSSPSESCSYSHSDSDSE